jgi:hypothetical protein
LALIFYNRTTWEVDRREYISYFSELPFTLDPFDAGCIANVWEFLMMAVNETEWEHPHPALLSDFLQESRFLATL